MEIQTQVGQPQLSGQVLLYSRPEPLNPEQHGNLGLSQVDQPFNFVRPAHAVPLTVTEFGPASLCFPIIFTGTDYQPLAIMSIRQNENLFITDQGYFEFDTYVPAYIRRYPFVLANNDNQEQLVVCIDRNAPMLTDFIDPKTITYLPNTAGCFDAESAIRTLRLAREAGGWDLVKLEVLGEARTLYPDMVETLRATEILANEGFRPMVYCVDDPIAAKRLEDVGAVAIMPLGAPIGSGLGIQNRVTIRLIVEGAKVPVLVDAGVGAASDAAVAMELGCDGVLMNTAIAEAKDPILMARAMKAAVEAGRLSYRAGRMGIRRYADPSSPLAGLI